MKRIIAVCAFVCAASIGLSDYSAAIGASQLPWHPNSILIDPAISRRQGHSIDVSGNLAIVGAYGNSGGHALIFDLATGTLLHRLRGNDVVSGDLFGFSVAIDGNLAIVGSGQNAAAYVFDATTGTQLRILRPSTSAFVRTVDINNGIAILGTPSADPGGPTNSGAGAITVYNANTGTQLRRINGPGGFNLNFGSALAIEGNTLAVSSPANFGNGEFRVFDAATGQLQWSYGYLEDGRDFRARDIVIDGDLIAVGVTRNTTKISDVLLFDRHNGDLIRRIDVNVNATDDYMSSIAMSGGRIAVGVWGYSIDGIGFAGAVHLFDASSGDHLATIENPDPQFSDNFGYDVSLSGQRLLVGASGDVSERGTTYVYMIPEPGSLALAFAGCALVYGVRRSRYSIAA